MRSRLLVASAGAHAAGLAAFLLLQWREAAPPVATPVEMVFEAPAEPSAPGASGTPAIAEPPGASEPALPPDEAARADPFPSTDQAGPPLAAAPAEPAPAPATPPDAPAPGAAAPQAPVPDAPLPDTATRPETALPEPMADAAAPPTPAPVPPPLPVSLQPLAQAHPRVPARPAPSKTKQPPRRDIAPARAPAAPAPARAFDAVQNGVGPPAHGSAAPPAAALRTPAPVVDLGPVTITNPRFRAPPAPPAYPALAREQGQEGEAVIRARLDREGNPDEVLLAASSGFPVLDRAALAAVRRWAFEPGRRGDEPVAAWVQVPVRFALR